MQYRISIESGYLRADLSDRTTGEETRQFLEAILAAAQEHSATRLLVAVRSSRPIFKVDQYGLLEYFRQAAERSPHRIALVGDTMEIRVSHKYIEFMARQHGVNIKCFAGESEAIQWIQSEA